MLNDEMYEFGVCFLGLYLKFGGRGMDEIGMQFYIKFWDRK